MSRHPIVNGRETTFVALAAKLDRETSCVRRHYRRLEERGPVSLRDLREPERIHQARARRDARIVAMRQGRRKPLLSIATTAGLSVQRVQQIAGRLR